MNLFGLSRADLDDAVEDESRRDTIGDAVAQSHKDTGEECGDGFVQIRPVDLLERGHHHHADGNQSGSGSREGNRADKGSQESGQREADGDDDGGQARASAGSDTGSALYEGGRIGGTDQGADGCGRRVREKSLIQFRLETGTAFHRLLVLGAEDAAATAGSDKGTDRIKGVGNAEREDRNQHKRQFGHIGKQAADTALPKDGEEGRGQCLARFREARGLLRRGDAKRNTDQGGNNDRNQDSALYLKDEKNHGQNQADDEDPELRLIQRRESRNTAVKIDDAYVQKTDISDEDTDAAADGVLQAYRNGLDDVLTDLRHRDEDVQKTADEDHGKRLLPGEAQRETYRVNEKGIQTHAGRLGVGNVRHQTHDQSTDDGSNDCGQEDRAPLHTGL